MTSAQNGRDRLIIFTRYPEPGLTKTRLIPALGAQGAADLHRLLTEHTLTQVRELLRADPGSLRVQVLFAGGNLQLMQDWLGSDLFYQPQCEGDLGARITEAFQEAFKAGALRVAIAGTDCPDLDAPSLAKAFEQLHLHDMVLGPAVDGGYYLIGLQRFIPELFTGITWGTSEVLQQTVAIARSLSLSYTLLPQLADIDRPEDLPILDSKGIIIPQSALIVKGCQPKSKISIIVPALNEAAVISQTLSCANLGENVEVIVVDGGSYDGTREVAEALGVKVISGDRGRALQMNAGAGVATGEILLFLHADTKLPVGFDAKVRQLLAEPGVVGGAFGLRIEAPGWGLRLVEVGVNWRSRWLGMPYGDQAIFLPAPVFERIGGFPEMPIMEDFELMRRLRRIGRIAIARTPVETSGRRWLQLGVLKTTTINQLVIIAYYLGVPTDRLACWYRRYGGKQEGTHKKTQKSRV